VTAGIVDVLGTKRASSTQIRHILRTGLYNNEAAGQELTDIYSQTLEKLTLLPATFHYRQQLETTLRRRIGMLEELKRAELDAEKDKGDGGLEVGEKEREGMKILRGSIVTSLEEEFGEGKLEEMIEQAQEELVLIEQMAGWKPWEDLECPP